MTRFPKTLLLSKGIPPAPTGMSVVTANLARQFSRDEMVVLGSYYVGYPPQTWDPEWPSLIYATVHPPDGWRGGRWLRWAQWPLLLLRAWWTVIAQDCQAILVAFPDEVYLLAAYVLARITQKPLYPYFHNTFLENRRGSRFARWLQPRVFAAARHVFVMSDGMQRLYEVNYPGLRCSPLVHSFNEPLPEPRDVSVPPLQQPLRLVLFGSFGGSNAEAATRIAELVRITPDVELTVFSGTSRSYLKGLGFSWDRITIKTVSYDELMKGLREADIVMLPHGFYGAIPDDEVATIFPTKTIEALISRRPILAHMPKDCFVTEFLARNDCALIVDEPNLQALTQGLDRLRQDSDLRAHLVRQALITARQFRASTVAVHLRDVMQNGTPAVVVNQALTGRR